MKRCYVGFDTSNYTTSAAVCSEEGEILANLKRPLPVREGERGVRQSEAVFSHVRNLAPLCDELKETLDGLAPVAVGVSSRPRDGADSYMPCFLSGVAAAHAFAAASDSAVYEFSHQAGHIMAALYRSGRCEELASREFLSFHVSGGTTDVLLVTPREAGFSVECVGGSADLHAGQVIDRVGVAMGLRFPCGREMEALATAFDGKLPRHRVTVRDGVCSLSGAENLAVKLYRETGDRQATAALVFDFICRTLIALGEDRMSVYDRLPVLFAGGVMSNRWMRKALCEHFDACFAPPEFSADNAAGIALLCRRRALWERI